MVRNVKVRRVQCDEIWASAMEAGLNGSCLELAGIVQSDAAQKGSIEGEKR